MLPPANAHTFLACALNYASRGWPVFPLAYKGKVPIINGGFYNAFTDENKIRCTWGPVAPGKANIAIRTGEPSQLVVLDIDPRHGGHDSLLQLLSDLDVDLECLGTYRVRTGSDGMHYYFRWPGYHIGNRTNIRPGIDLRGDGGYVVAAPSLHENGQTYTVEDANAPVLPFPERVLDYILKQRAAPVAQTASSGTVVEGGRNDYLFRFGCALRRPGASYEAIEACLLAQNASVCRPPLDKAEVLEIARKAARYEPVGLASTNYNSQPAPPADGRQGPVGVSCESPGTLVTVEDPPSLVVKASDLMQALFEYLGDKDKLKGKPTGIATLDKLFGGGKRTGEITAWHAQAKTGKNSLWHKLMHNWLEDGTPIAYASREISPEFEVLPNLLSLHTASNVWNEPLTAERKERYAAALMSWPLYFASGFGFMPLEDITRWVGELAQQGVQYFWFDHLHFLLEDPEDHKAAAKLVVHLKKLAQKERIHIDLIIQPNRLEPGRELDMHSMKGGAVINQTVDNLIILKRMEEENVMQVKMELGRSKLIKRGHLYVQYNEQTTDFIEVQRELAERANPAEKAFFRKGPIADRLRAKQIE